MLGRCSSVGGSSSGEEDAPVCDSFATRDHGVRQGYVDSSHDVDRETARQLRALADGAEIEALSEYLDANFNIATIAAPEALAYAVSVRQEDLLRTGGRFALASHLMRIDVPAPAAVLAEFTAVVADDPSPLVKDRLGLSAMQMQQLTLDGRIAEASVHARDISDRVLSQVERIGIVDILPVVLVEAGIVQITAGEMNAAIGNFRAAARWSSLNGGHPAGHHADDFVDLVHALQGDLGSMYRSSGIQPSAPRGAPGGRAWLWTAVPHMTYALNQLHRGDLDGAQERLEALDLPRDGATVSPFAGLWWLPVHVRARLALQRGEGGAAIRELRSALQDWQAFLGPDTFAGSLLRADLSDLLQAVSEYDDAQAVLAEAVAGPQIPQLIASRARLLWLVDDRGGLDDLLRRIGRFHPANSAELDVLRLLRRARGRVGVRASREAAELATSIADRASALDMGLLVGSGVVDPELQPHVSAAIETGIALPFRPVSSSRLTRSEEHLILELREFETIQELADRLFLAPTTVKSRLRDIYRKTGLRSKAEVFRERDRVLRGDG